MRSIEYRGEEAYAVSPYIYDHIREHLQGVIDQIYSDNPNKDAIEFSLDEVVGHFDLKLPVRV